MLRPLRSSNSGIVWARGRTEIKAVLVLLTPCRLSKTHSDWTSLLRTTRHFGSTAEVSVRHIGSAAEVSGHFGSIPLLPKCPTAKVSCCRSVRTPLRFTARRFTRYQSVLCGPKKTTALLDSSRGTSLFGAVLRRPQLC